MNKPVHLSVILLSLFFLNACFVSSPMDQFRDLFADKEIRITDTLHLSIDNRPEHGEEALDSTILQMALGDSILLLVNPEYSPEETKWSAKGYIDLDAQHRAYVLAAQDFWWLHMGAVIYHRSDQRITQVMPLVSLIGGDGGQEIRESWLIWDRNPKQVVAGFLGRYVEMLGDSVVEHTQNRVKLYAWSGNGFAEQTVEDSLSLIQAFHVDW